MGGGGWMTALAVLARTRTRGAETCPIGGCPLGQSASRDQEDGRRARW